MERLLAELQDHYGSAEGMRIFNTVLPGIMGDFNKMLKSTGVGKTVSEEYRMEDGSGVIFVKGHRKADGEIETEFSFKAGSAF